MSHIAAQSVLYKDSILLYNSEEELDVKFSKFNNLNIFYKQVCIPVGYVPSARFPYLAGGLSAF